MSQGWIYLKKMTDHNGNATAYCFGKTSNFKRRDKEYRKENPFIVHLEDFETKYMRAAEGALISASRRQQWLLRGNSDEWIKPEYFREFKSIWDRVKCHYSTDGNKCHENIQRQRQLVNATSALSDALKSVDEAGALLYLEEDSLLVDVPDGKFIDSKSVNALLENRQRIIKELTPVMFLPGDIIADNVVQPYDFWDRVFVWVFMGSLMLLAMFAAFSHTPV